MSGYNIWKELCMDKKYSHICHFEDEIMNKIEKSLNRYSKNMKLKQINQNQKEQCQSVKGVITENNNISTISYQYSNSTIQNQGNIGLDNSNGNGCVYNVLYENTNNTATVSNSNIKYYVNMPVTMTPSTNNYNIVTTNENSLPTTNNNSHNINYSLPLNSTDNTVFIPVTNTFYHQIPINNQYQTQINQYQT
ncbi:hypothetical protein PIROE2DRAFT_16883 [Piromyces sp. E2]|nr:hypothetical protein PIROE2DRAFT_16883 [Piromyces sp. E2]|eukprot:OUM57977.1 hypothetical protein PIROE2DRAFT_16883 [Piromyces sp. E2]